jgi:hypothetical protein
MHVSVYFGLVPLLAVVSSLTAYVTTSHAQTKPAEVQTIAPPVQLSGEQLQAIAAKSVPPTLHAAALLHPLSSWKPGAAIKPAPSAGIAPATRLAGAENAVPVKLPPVEGPAVKMTPQDSRPGTVNTIPGWLDPFSLKRDEIAVIGGLIVLIPHPAVTPERGRAGR